MKNRWSPTAGVVGFVFAVILCSASDIKLNFFLGILCPAPVILGFLLRSFHFHSSVVPTWFIILEIAISAAGNAIWYMLVAETFRLLIQKIRLRHS